MSFLTLLAWAALARADTPPVFAQDPLCDTSVDFRNEPDLARPLHLKSPRLAAATNGQSHWFNGLSKEMTSICETDRKFAEELTKRVHPNFTGQCKPAGEAASIDQEVLDRSEARLSKLSQLRDLYLSKGKAGERETLAQVYLRDKKAVDNFAGDTEEVDLKAYCELKWIYPAAFLDKTTKVTGCPAFAPFDHPSDTDKKDAGLFAKMVTRLTTSVTYNTQRRDIARAAALASRARYDECVKQFPDSVPTPLKSKASAKGSPDRVPAPSGQGHGKGSDITGTENAIQNDQKSP